MNLPLVLILASTLSGTVTSQGGPVASAQIRAAGNNRVVQTMSDSAGHFAFTGLPLGTYQVEARAKERVGRVRVDLGSGGAEIAIVLGPVSEIAHVVTVRSSQVRGSGADVTLNNTDLTRAPFTSFPEALIQLPGAVRGANGVVHMNGDHGVIDYVVDGVPIPQALNREMGSEINPNDISFLDVIEGAYPAEYGLKFGDVLNITTKAGIGPSGFDGGVSYGSYSDITQALNYHTPFAHGGGFSIGLRNEQSTRGLDPPDFNSPHNDASDTNQFARLTLPGGGGDFTDLTLTHSFRTYQVPNDVEGGEPANTDDSETQNDAFLALQWHHAIGSTGALTLGPALKYSRIQDFGDPTNDFIYTSTPDCANALTTANFGPTTCGFSLADDKTALDYIFQGDYVRQQGRHDVRAGAGYDLTRVMKNYAVTLQPNNFLAPGLTPGTPNAATTVTDDNPNVGNTYTSYVQDNWRMSPLWEADYGMRYDYFSIRSTDFARGWGAFSPRFKITRYYGQRASVYAYVGRFFEPFSFENVDPRAAQLLNLPLQPTLAQFDLKPERDTQLELGGHVPFGSGSLGFRVWQKNANDLIDDTQVGVTLLHQDINYTLGRLSQEALDYTQPLSNGGRAYVNVAHTLSLNAGCETQLLAPCFGSPTGFTPADHDQAYSVTGGVLLNAHNGGWFSADSEYGSGLSSAICPPGTPGFCKRTPHTIFAVEKGVPVNAHATLALSVQNLLNDRYYVTILNAQGNHYAPGRAVNVTFSFH